MILVVLTRESYFNIILILFMDERTEIILLLRNFEIFALLRLAVSILTVAVFGFSPRLANWPSLHSKFLAEDTSHSKDEGLCELCSLFLVCTLCAKTLC